MPFGNTVADMKTIFTLVKRLQGLMINVNHTIINTNQQPFQHHSPNTF